MQEIAGSSPGDHILRKNAIISWDLKFTRVLSQDAAWRETQEIQTLRISDLSQCPHFQTKMLDLTNQYQ